VNRRNRVAHVIGGIIDRLAELQIRQPLYPLAAVLVVSVFFGWVASHLELRTRYDQLLPDTQPSVVELRRVEKRTTIAQTVIVVLEGDDEMALRAFGDAIVPRLAALSDILSNVEDGVQEARKYLQPRAGLFLDTPELEKMKADVDARWDWEVSHEMGTALDDDDAPPRIDKQELQKRFESAAKRKTGSRNLDQYKDGYYQRPDGKALVVLAHSPVPGGDLDRVQSAIERMHAAVAAAQATNPAFAKIHVGWAGDMIAGFEEYGAVRNDLLHVGVIGVGLVLGVVLLFFMRFRSLLVMGITITCALSCTFGLTQIAIGHLNIATGFLFSIIAGNGINVGIIYLSRYYEEKRRGALTADAVRMAHKTTWPSTAVAAIAAAASYSSLLATDFRAFKHFGIIGAGGMIVCWCVTITLLPTLLLLLDKQIIPQGVERGWFARLRWQGVPFGQLFAAIVPKAPRFLVALGAVVAVVGVAASIRYARNDPMEYDLTKIQNDRSENNDLRHSWDVANSILGQFPSAMLVLADTPAHADELQAKLTKIWEAAPVGNKPFESVHSIFSFIPHDQETKLPTLMALSARLRRAHERGMITDDDWKQMEVFLPKDDLTSFGANDLPGDVARPFTEKNGTRGTVVLIEPRLDVSTDDLHYLIQYSNSFRETHLDDGTVLLGCGRAVTFADILSAVVHDIPKAVGLALAMTLLAVFVTFQRGAHSATVLLTLLVGLSGVGTFLYLAKVHLNFLNFAALPITFGIGVDYAVNIMQRYHADGGKSIIAALRTTGGAVVLCSMTTTLGYFALVGSHNQAIRSLGTVAVVGEMSCLAAAVLVLPAFWYLVERSRASSSK
jgi:predicted RND superfamily exporter protein